MAGVDYTQSFSPVATESSIRTFFLLSLYNNWLPEMIDIEAAFLEADLDVPVFVEWETGLEELGMLTKANK